VSAAFSFALGFTCPRVVESAVFAGGVILMGRRGAMRGRREGKRGEEVGLDRQALGTCVETLERWEVLSVSLVAWVCTSEVGSGASAAGAETRQLVQRREAMVSAGQCWRVRWFRTTYSAQPNCSRGVVRFVARATEWGSGAATSASQPTPQRCSMFSSFRDCADSE
jgi:hypothetical protein